MFGTFNTKTLLAAASLAVMTAAGMASASAAPWDHRDDRVMDHRMDRPGDRHDMWRHDRFDNRRVIERVRVDETLRFHRYRMLGEPYFVRGHYVVRSHDRFGRLVFVEVNPHSGAFIGEFRI